MTSIQIINRSQHVVRVDETRTAAGLEVVISRHVNTDDLIGKPWRLGARGPDAFDCWGLVLELAGRCGHVVPADWRTGDLNRTEQRALMDTAARDRTQRLDRPADGAIAYSDYAAHVGFVLYGRVIHSRRGAGVVASSIGFWLESFPDTRWHAWQA